jgi:hypothetical protein
MQKLGLEWLFRLITEPRRLWKRYIFGNPTFIYLVIKQRLGLFDNRYGNFDYVKDNEITHKVK